MAAKATELVIFDCDGVLVDSEPISIAVLVEALAAAGVAMSEEEAYERFLGRSLKSMSEILHDDYGLAIDTAFLEAMRKAGETEARINLLNAWEESELYTPRERAALRWTEELTRASERSPSDAAYEELREHFSEKDSVDLSFAIGAINTWNRINVGFRTRHPADRPRKTEAAA